MMISASSRACVLNGETTMWRTRLRNAIIEDQPTRSRLSCQRGWSFRQGQLPEGRRKLFQFIPCHCTEAPEHVHFLARVPGNLQPLFGAAACARISVANRLHEGFG